MNIPESAAGVTVSCRASTTGEVDAKKVPTEIRTMNIVKIMG
jgi:hypothetical protein